MPPHDPGGGRGRRRSRGGRGSGDQRDSAHPPGGPGPPAGAPLVSSVDQPGLDQSSGVPPAADAPDEGGEWHIADGRGGVVGRGRRGGDQSGPGQPAPVRPGGIPKPLGTASHANAARLARVPRKLAVSAALDAAFAARTAGMGSVRFHLRADAHAAGADYADLADPISEAMQKDLTAFIERHARERSMFEPDFKKVRDWARKGGCKPEVNHRVQYDHQARKNVGAFYYVLVECPKEVELVLRPAIEIFCMGLLPLTSMQRDGAGTAVPLAAIVPSGARNEEPMHIVQFAVVRGTPDPELLAGVARQNAEGFAPKWAAAFKPTDPFGYAPIIGTWRDTQQEAGSSTAPATPAIVHTPVGPQCKGSRSVLVAGYGGHNTAHALMWQVTLEAAGQQIELVGSRVRLGIGKRCQPYQPRPEAKGPTPPAAAPSRADMMADYRASWQATAGARGAAGADQPAPVAGGGDRAEPDAVHDNAAFDGGSVASYGAGDGGDSGDGGDTNDADAMEEDERGRRQEAGGHKRTAAAVAGADGQPTAAEPADPRPPVRARRTTARSGAEEDAGGAAMDTDAPPGVEAAAAAPPEAAAATAAPPAATETAAAPPDTAEAAAAPAEAAAAFATPPPGVTAAAAPPEAAAAATAPSETARAVAAPDRAAATAAAATMPSEAAAAAVDCTSAAAAAPSPPAAGDDAADPRHGA